MVIPPNWKKNLISDQIVNLCKELETCLIKLEPQMVVSEHLSSLKKALFHSHTEVVQMAVKQFIKIGTEKSVAEHLSGDLELILGIIENLAHKDQHVARDCVTVLLLLSCSPKALMHLLCHDVTDVLKTIMTYVAVRLLVYEFILQLSINSALGLEKSHTCGILEDVINDFKKKESYLTVIHHHQLQCLSATSHGRNYLIKYGAVDCVSKCSSLVTNESLAHLIFDEPTVVPPLVTEYV